MLLTHAPNNNQFRIPKNKFGTNNDASWMKQDEEEDEDEVEDEDVDEDEDEDMDEDEDEDEDEHQAKDEDLVETMQCFLQSDTL